MARALTRWPIKCHNNRDAHWRSQGVVVGVGVGVVVVVAMAHEVVDLTLTIVALVA